MVALAVDAEHAAVRASLNKPRFCFVEIEVPAPVAALAAGAACSGLQRLAAARCRWRGFAVRHPSGPRPRHRAPGCDLGTRGRGGRRCLPCACGAGGRPGCRAWRERHRARRAQCSGSWRGVRTRCAGRHQEARGPYWQDAILCNAVGAISWRRSDTAPTQRHQPASTLPRISGYEGGHRHLPNRSCSRPRLRRLQEHCSSPHFASQFLRRALLRRSARG